MILHLILQYGKKKKKKENSRKDMTWKREKGEPLPQ